ncbi:MAG: hypothetical protein IJY91_02795, partial [Oscillospiraceae bacterium]|nr:hypothetical protein [Oscillospiraceae bacterium]
YSFPRGEAVTALAVTDEECGQKSYDLCAETDSFLTFSCRRSSSVFCHCLYETMAKSTFPRGKVLLNCSAKFQFSFILDYRLPMW